MSIAPPNMNPAPLPGNGNIIINISQPGQAWGQSPRVTVNGTPVNVAPLTSDAGLSTQYGQPGQPGQSLNAVSSGILPQAVSQAPVITPEMQRQQALNALQPDIQNVQYAYQVAMQKRQEAEVARMTYMTLANDVNQRIQAILNNSINGTLYNNAPMQQQSVIGYLPQQPSVAGSVPMNTLSAPDAYGNPYGNTYGAPPSPITVPPAVIGMPNTPVNAVPAQPSANSSIASPFPNAVPTEQLPALPTDPATPSVAPTPVSPAEASVINPPAATTAPAPAPAPVATAPTQPEAAPSDVSPAPNTTPADPNAMDAPQQLSDFPLYKQLSQQTTPQLQGLLRDILSIPNAQGQVNQLSDPNLYSLQTIEFILFILRNRPDAATNDTYGLLKQLKDMGLVMATLKDPSIDDWKKKDSEVILMESLWAAAKLDSFQPPNTPISKLQGYNTLIKPILDGTETVPPLITMAAVQAISPDMFARYNEIPADTLNKLQARLSKAISNSGERKWSTLGLSKYPTLSEEDKAIYTQTIQLAEMVKRGQSLSSLPGVAAGPAGMQQQGPMSMTGMGMPNAGPIASLPGMPPLSPSDVDALMQSLPPDQRQAIESMANDLLANAQSTNGSAMSLPPNPAVAPSSPVTANTLGAPPQLELMQQPALNVAG